MRTRSRRPSPRIRLGRPHAPPTLALALLALLAAPTAIAGTYVGALAREIEVEDVVNARNLDPGDVKLAGQSGNTVVMVFFSTTCESCPKVMPHLNDLARTFANEPVTIWGVNHEGRDALERFIPQYDLQVPVLVDEDFSIQQQYLISGVPMMVVINPSGVVAAKVHPLEVDDDDIRVAMDGRTPDVPLAPDPPGLLSQTRSEQLAISEAIVRPAAQSREPSFSRVGGLRFDATPLRDILGAIWGVSAPMVYAEDVLLDAKYDVSVIPPRGRESEAVDRLRHLLTETFGIEVEKTTRDVEVLVLTAPDGPGPVLQPPRRPRFQIQLRPGALRARNATMEQVAEKLSDALGAPVIDATGIDDRYDLNVLWKPRDRDSLIRALREQLGVELSAESREREVLDVRRTADPPAEQG